MLAISLSYGQRHRGDVIATTGSIGLINEPFYQWPPSTLLVTKAVPDLLVAQHLQAALERTGGNISEAAALLGIARSTFYQKLKKKPFT
jgi:transcriptional regulator with AAA-type ATPase domain